MGDLFKGFAEELEERKLEKGDVISLDAARKKKEDAARKKAEDIRRSEHFGHQSHANRITDIVYAHTDKATNGDLDHPNRGQISLMHRKRLNQMSYDDVLKEHQHTHPHMYK